MEKIVCPFIKRKCIECPIYRGRHMYYCLFDKRDEQVSKKEVSWDKDVIDELMKVGHSSQSILKDLEDTKNL